jgi:hypothetical protein
MLNKKKAITSVKSKEMGAATRTDAMGDRMPSIHESTRGKSIKSGPKIKRKDRIAQMLEKYPKVMSRTP